MSTDQVSIASIDVWRGIAAIVVAYFHSREILWVGMRGYASEHGFESGISSLVAYLTFPVAFGSIGVAIFFVISGYCIHRSQAIGAARNQNFEMDVPEYFIRRCVRIYPVLLAALVLTFAFDSGTAHFQVDFPKQGALGLTTFVENL